MSTFYMSDVCIHPQSNTEVEESFPMEHFSMNIEIQIFLDAILMMNQRLSKRILNELCTNE